MLGFDAFQAEMIRHWQFDLPAFQNSFRRQRIRQIVAIALGLFGFALGILTFFPFTMVIFLFAMYFLYLVTFGKRRRVKRVKKDSELRRLLIKATTAANGHPFSFLTHRYMPAFVFKESELFPFKPDIYEADELVEVNASGKVTFTADDAETLKAQNQKTILVRLETSPEDIHGMNAAEGILTCRGGMTSHAAVVARGMGRPCVSGAGTIQIDYKAKNFRVGDREVKEGDIITIDGSTGEVMVGEVTTIKPDISGDFSTIMSWADEARTLKIRTNAETPLDTKVAREFGAEGIGLCRTEHMFFD